MPCICTLLFDWHYPALASENHLMEMSHSSAFSDACLGLQAEKTQLHINIKHFNDSLLVQIIECVRVFFGNHDAQLLHLLTRCACKCSNRAL
jgi:hypothetical protein